MRDYPLLKAFRSRCLLFQWVLWLLILLFSIIGDILRSRSLNNWTPRGVGPRGRAALPGRSAV